MDSDGPIRSYPLPQPPLSSPLSSPPDSIKMEDADSPVPLEIGDIAASEFVAKDVSLTGLDAETEEMSQVSDSSAAPSAGPTPQRLQDGNFIHNQQMNIDSPSKNPPVSLQRKILADIRHTASRSRYGGHDPAPGSAAVISPFRDGAFNPSSGAASSTPRFNAPQQFPAELRIGSRTRRRKADLLEDAGTWSASPGPATRYRGTHNRNDATSQALSTADSLRSPVSTARTEHRNDQAMLHPHPEDGPSMASSSFQSVNRPPDFRTLAPRSNEQPPKVDITDESTYGYDANSSASFFPVRHLDDGSRIQRGPMRGETLAHPTSFVTGSLPGLHHDRYYTTSSRPLGTVNPSHACAPPFPTLQPLPDLTGPPDHRFPFSDPGRGPHQTFDPTSLTQESVPGTWQMMNLHELGESLQFDIVPRHGNALPPILLLAYVPRAHPALPRETWGWTPSGPRRFRDGAAVPFEELYSSDFLQTTPPPPPPTRFPHLHSSVPLADAFTDPPSAPNLQATNPHASFFSGSFPPGFAVGHPVQKIDSPGQAAQQPRPSSEAVPGQDTHPYPPR